MFSATTALQRNLIEAREENVFVDAFRIKTSEVSLRDYSDCRTIIRGGVTCLLAGVDVCVMSANPSTDSQKRPNSDKLAMETLSQVIFTCRERGLTRPIA